MFNKCTMRPNILAPDLQGIFLLTLHDYVCTTKETIPFSQ